VAAQPTYILSDRMVPESRILFYRYGEHLATEAVNAWGSGWRSIGASSRRPEPVGPRLKLAAGDRLAVVDDRRGLRVRVRRCPAGEEPGFS
jgi:hypothetical protein